MSAVFPKMLRGNFIRLPSSAQGGNTPGWSGGDYYWGKQMASGGNKHSGNAGRQRGYYQITAMLGQARRAYELRLKKAA